MKTPSKIFGMISLVFVLSLPVFADETESSFEKLYIETAHETHELMEMVSDAAGTAEFDLETLLPTVDALIKNAEALEKTALKIGKNIGADEAAQMKAYLNRIKATIETKTGKSELMANLSEYHLHLNNLLMVTPTVLKNVLGEHLDELKTAIEKNQTKQLEHLAEHFNIHANQMYYAAMIFGKKIWQKFSNKIKENAGQMLSAAKSGNMDSLKKLAAEVEKPVRMLQEIVKE
jgi:hypothetical protein